MATLTMSSIAKSTGMPAGCLRKTGRPASAPSARLRNCTVVAAAAGGGASWEKRAEKARQDAERNLDNASDKASQNFDKASNKAERGFDQAVNKADREFDNAGSKAQNKLGEFEDRARDVTGKARHNMEEAEETMARKTGSSSPGYNVLVASFALYGVAALVAPQRLAEFIFSDADLKTAAASAARLHFNNHLCLTLMRSFGSLAIVAATSAFTCLSAADKNNLDSPTYLRQNLGLIAWGAGTFVLHLISRNILTTFQTVSGVGLGAATLLVASRNYASNSEDGASPVGVLKSLVHDAVRVVKIANLNSAVYALAVVGSAVMAFTCLTGGGEMGNLFNGEFGPKGMFMKRWIGCGWILVATLAATLKDAADRGRLGAGTFKALNLGFGILGAAQSFVLYDAAKAGLTASSPLGQGLLWSFIATAIAGFWNFFTASHH